MSAFLGTPSDEVPDVLAIGRSDVTTVFVSLSARDPVGRDAEYIRWHSLDHRPEQHRLAGIRGSLRLVSTPACRSARAASDPRYDATDHVMTYFFADPSALDPFFTLGRTLAAAGRMPLRLPRLETDAYRVAGRAAASRVVAGADVIPWRPARGVYLLLEQGMAAADPLCAVDGVAGVWWATNSPREESLWPRGTRASDEGVAKQVTYCFLDDDPVVVAEQLRPVVERRWRDSDVTPLLAAPFHSVVPYEWDKHVP